MSVKTRFDRLNAALKLVIILPPAAGAFVVLLAFAGDQLPATRKSVGNVLTEVQAVGQRIDTVEVNVQRNHEYGHELLAQQAQMLCLMEDKESGRAERCLRAYQDKKNVLETAEHAEDERNQ